MNKELNTLSVIENDQGVVRIALNRPERHNAFNPQLISELSNQLLELKSNQQVRILVIEGKGESFCSGADLQWMAEMKEKNYQDNLADATDLANMFSLLNNFPQPTLTKIHGTAAGGALGLIACSDIAIAASDTQFCFSEVKFGLAPATICPYILSAIGERAARRYFLTAETFSSAIALKLGLIHQVVDEMALDKQVDDFIELILCNGPQALRETKLLLHKMAGMEISEETKQYTSDLIARLRVSDEALEGLTAFFEKRPPSWK